MTTFVVTMITRKRKRVLQWKTNQSQHQFDLSQTLKRKLKS